MSYKVHAHGTPYLTPHGHAFCAGSSQVLSVKEFMFLVSTKLVYNTIKVLDFILQDIFLQHRNSKNRTSGLLE